MIKVILALLLFAAPLDSTELSLTEKTGEAPAKGGEKISWNDGKISMVFPGAVITEVQESDGAKTMNGSTTVDNVTYFLGWTLHSLELVDPVSLAEVSLESFTEATGGEITSREKYMYKKHEGISAHISLGESGALIYKVVIIGQDQIQMVVASEKGEFGSAATKFFKSFKHL